MLRRNPVLKEKRLHLIKQRHRQFILKNDEQVDEAVGAPADENEIFEERFDFAN